MVLRSAEFEESEYRGPLFNQLGTNQFVWEPGQVFEQYIGVDYALLCTHPLICKICSWSGPAAGVQLFRYNFDYIWLRRRGRKSLPPFRLNMFIQAKRPAYGRYAPKALKLLGLGSPYWRFEVTPHQQVALETLSNQLGARAIVVYASPLFHKSVDLYRHTTNRTVVDNSTFPDATALTTHQAWNYSTSGATGVANVDPAQVDGPGLLQRIETLANGDVDGADPNAQEDLAFLSQAVRDAVNACDDFWQARFAEGLGAIDQALEDLDDEMIETTRHFLKVLLFCELFHTTWNVLGALQRQPPQRRRQRR